MSVWLSFGRKLWSKEETEKKGPCLVYRFQQSMESGDASDEEASPWGILYHHMHWAYIINILMILVGPNHLGHAIGHDNVWALYIWGRCLIPSSKQGFSHDYWSSHDDVMMTLWFL